jgi:uncharacterized protein with FMN-binding domain
MRTGTIKSIAALALTGVGSALVVGFRTTPDPAGATTPAAGVDAASGSTSRTGTTSRASSGSGSSNGSAGSNGSRYADGTWTGKAVSEPWGPFQVQVTINGGTITNVSVIESPADGRSSRINSVAVPLLTKATLADQASNVDFVSGATWTSDSYARSLQSALDKAHAA